MKERILINDILAFEQRYRITFINSLGGFKSLALIGTINEQGQTNLAVFNSFFHLGADPPLFGFIVRPDSVERHTLANILLVKQFTVNHVNKEIYRQAHQTSARYSATTSEFDVTGLTAEYIDTFKAPFVKESTIKIGAEFIRKIDLYENGTSLVVAKLNKVLMPKDCLADDGYVDLEKAGTLTCSGLDSYHETTKISRLPYAKPDTFI
jgi:flavin reductase (DIM6/NTAB) family NADH-FMN oxidoreductase RutF